MLINVKGIMYWRFFFNLRLTVSHFFDVSHMPHMPHVSNSLFKTLVRIRVLDLRVVKTRFHPDYEQDHIHEQHL